LRRRTETDELAIRTFFAEGDLLVAEVQQLFSDGGASLHTRSLRYGKLRNGLFLALGGGGGTGGGGGVVRAKRQVWDFGARLDDAGVRIEVVLGVNGYCFVGARSALTAGAAAGVGASNMEENVSAGMYASQNDPLDGATMREIARVRSVIVTLVEHGLKVDEEMVMRGYAAALEDEDEEMGGMDGGSGEGRDYLGGERGKRLAMTLLAAGKGK
jgi:exosome complex component RRP4